MNENIQNSNIAKNNNNNVNPLENQQVDFDDLEKFNSKLQEGFKQYKDDYEYDSGSEQTQTDAEIYEKLGQYSNEVDEVLSTLDNLLDEAYDSNSVKDAYEYLLTICEKIDPEFVAEVDSEYRECISEIDEAREKYENGEISDEDVVAVREDAHNTIISLQSKLMSYARRHKALNQQHHDTNIDANSSIGSYRGSDSTFTTNTDEQTNSQANDKNTYKASYKTTNSALNKYAGFQSSVSEMLANPENTSVVLIAMLVMLEMADIASDCVLLDSAQLSSNSNYVKYLTDVKGAYQSLQTAFPYYADIDGDGKIDKETEKIDDLYTLISIAQISDSSSPAYDPSNEFYDPDLAEKMKGMVNFLNEKYPDEMKQITWMNPIDIEDAGGSKSKYTVADVKKNQDAIYSIFTNIVDQSNDCLEKVGGKPISYFSTVEVKNDGYTYNTFKITDTVLSTAIENLGNGITTGNNKSEELTAISEADTTSFQSCISLSHSFQQTWQSIWQNLTR